MGTDAPIIGATLTRGSPLCGAFQVGGGCYPDEMATPKECAMGADGGSYDPTASSDGILACHVQAGGPPACQPAGPGYTSASCNGPSGKMGCAAGLECVGTGQCRHYCCSGTSACALNEFCDVQPTFLDPQSTVPVCMLLTPCALFSNDTCPSDQQCAVTREDGATSCVAVGAAKAGESCERDHCALGLLCVGTVGSRRCSPLCHTATSAECAIPGSPGSKCVGTLPLFQNLMFGVCQ
jgi:hypothetical protein